VRLRSWAKQYVAFGIMLALMYYGATYLDSRLATAAPVPLWPQATVVDLKVWPQEITVDTGQSVQFYAAVQLTDGSVGCTDAGPEWTFPPWTNTAECDSAVALLPEYEPADTPFVRFLWSPPANQNVYDSLFYQLRVADIPDLTPMVVTGPLADTMYDWRFGLADSIYQVDVRASAWWRGDSAWSAWSAPVEFSYPAPFPIPLQLAPVRVDTLSGGG